MLAGRPPVSNERQNMKDTEKKPTRTVVVHWDWDVREKVAEIVSDMVNAPKGTPVSGSHPIQRTP